MPTVAAPLEDENLLPEILVRLARLPSALPRASLVCKRWRLLVSDRRFVRRFRAHHLRSPPPLIGFFEEVTREPSPDSPQQPLLHPDPGSPQPRPGQPLLPELPQRRRPHDPRLPRRSRAPRRRGGCRDRGPGVGPHHRRPAPLRRPSGDRRAPGHRDLKRRGSPHRRDPRRPPIPVPCGLGGHRQAKQAAVRLRLLVGGRQMG
ncbi:hypothetical protein VPH35_085761 [Triticum aestivum]